MLLKPYIHKSHLATSAIWIFNKTKKQVKKIIELAAKIDVIKSINSRIASCSQLLPQRLAKGWHISYMQTQSDVPCSYSFLFSAQF